MREFKVGDRIKIKSWEKMEKEYGTINGDIDIRPWFVKDMKILCGKEATISEINNGYIRLKNWSFDGEVYWNFCTKMFEPLKERDTNFKVGDKIRIRSWEDMKNEFGVEKLWNNEYIPCKGSFMSKMKNLCSRTAVLERIDSDGYIRLTNWSNNNNINWGFSTDMIEKIEENQSINTYRKGNEVISELKINDKVVKTAKARCCPTDTFDFNIGAKLSLERLLEDKKENTNVYIKLLTNGGYDFNKKGDILKSYKIDKNIAYVRTEDQIRSVGDCVSEDWAYLEWEYEILKDYDPEDEKNKVKAGDYIELLEENYSFDKVGMILKVNEVKNDMVYVLPESYPEGSMVYYSSFVSKNGSYGSWRYEKDWYKVLKDYVPPKKNKGRDLIGRKITAGTRFKVIKISPERRDSLVCKDAYIGKIARFNYDFTIKDDEWGGSATFEKSYMNGIDDENGRLCWRWDEIEILD